MTTPPTPARTLKPNLWARIKADLRPGPERWRHAIRVAAAGMLIIGVQMTLRYELLYPGMTMLLILTESRGLGTVTRWLFAMIGATVGCAAAVALMALFIQQPFFLLPIMWGYIIVVMYFMGSSRYRGAWFAAGYPFIVAVYMSFFDKGDAEHIAIMVYKSAITGICCTAIVMIFLWPERPEESLKQRLLRGMERSRALIGELIEVASGRRSIDLARFVPEQYRARGPAMIALLEQAETDLALGDDVCRRLRSLIATDTRAAATLSVYAHRVGDEPEPQRAETVSHLRVLDGRLAEAQEATRHEIGRIEDRPDFGTLLLRNLRRCWPRLVRKPLWPPESAQLRHAVKCSSAIMICALFCIAVNWTMGIGCVETVMLVVQATLGGTLLIGGLRMVGVVFGFTVSILILIWLIPTITTLPGLLVIFGGLLLLVGYAMHGSPRVSVPALQTMIVADFALLQVTSPSIDLDPAMDFSLAVGMGVVVTFAIYRLLWPVHATLALKPAVDAMVNRVTAFTRQYADTPPTLKAIDEAQLQFSDNLAACVSFQSNAQLEAPQSPAECERELQSIEDAASSCETALTETARRVVQRASPRPGE